jgi:hypothetical protein
VGRALNARLLEAIVRHRVPAIGFVNEGKLAAGAAAGHAKVAFLQMWIPAE